MRLVKGPYRLGWDECKEEGVDLLVPEDEIQALEAEIETEAEGDAAWVEERAQALAAICGDWDAKNACSRETTEQGDKRVTARVQALAREAWENEWRAEAEEAEAAYEAAVGRIQAAIQAEMPAIRRHYAASEASEAISERATQAGRRRLQALQAAIETRADEIRTERYKRDFEAAVEALGALWPPRVIGRPHAGRYYADLPLADPGAREAGIVARAYVDSHGYKRAGPHTAIIRVAPARGARSLEVRAESDVSRKDAVSLAMVAAREQGLIRWGG